MRSPGNSSSWRRQLARSVKTQDCSASLTQHPRGGQRQPGKSPGKGGFSDYINHSISKWSANATLGRACQSHSSNRDYKFCTVVAECWELFKEPGTRGWLPTVSEPGPATPSHHGLPPTSSSLLHPPSLSSTWCFNFAISTTKTWTNFGRILSKITEKRFWKILGNLRFWRNALSWESMTLD